MPVESRLRAALAEQAAEVRVDAEQPLQRLHQRRARRLAGLWASAVATAMVVAVGAAAVLVPESDRPEPTGPGQGEHAEPTPRAFPLGRYVREVTAGEALADGFPRAEVRHLFDGDERVQVVMTFRRVSEFRAERNGWVVSFVDQDGQRRIRDGGSFTVGTDGELDIASKWIDCLGCGYHFDWALERGRLTLEATPLTQPRAMAALLEGGTWLRQRG